MPDAAGPEIVIAGTREDWPGGAQTLTPRSAGATAERGAVARYL